MKERIKKFAKDHQDEINLVMVGLGVAMSAVGIAILVKGDGHHVDGVFSGNDVAGGSTVFVQLRNGNVLPYTKPEA